MGDLVQAYAQWLQTTQQVRFGTVANYINSLISVTTYVYTEFEGEHLEAAMEMDPNPLTQLINLRSQAEKAAKTQQMYEPETRAAGWIEWPEVQKARLAACAKAQETAANSKARRSALKEAAALSLLSLIPPDRVGIIRKLRLGHTLKRKTGGVGWKIDLSRQRDGHKTSRFYGPFAASLPSALTPVLDSYTAMLEQEPGGDEGYLFGPANGALDRPLENSAWTMFVRRLFKRHHGSEVAPKTLRSSFITWLRDQTNAPDVLKAAAHAVSATGLPPAPHTRPLLIYGLSPLPRR